MYQKITVGELESCLRMKEYKVNSEKLTGVEKRNKDYISMEKNNRILGRSFHHTFEKWHRKWKRVPTPQEFVAMQMQDVEKNFSNQFWKTNHRINFELTPIVRKGLKNRLLRSYISFINELHTELLIKELYPKLEIIRNEELDYAGIDILAYNKKLLIEHKIHITKASEWGIDYLFKKEGKKLEFRGYQGSLYARPSWKKVNHPIYSQRDFKGHTFFLYSDKLNDDSVRFVNGYPLFTRAYVVTKIEADNIRFSKAG